MYESIVEVVEDYARRTPDALCMADKDMALTYGEAWAEAQGSACALQARGIGARDFLMVDCTQDVKYLVMKLACELCGAVFVPVEHRASGERVEKILSDTGAKLFLSDADYDVPVRMASTGEVFKEGRTAPGEILSFPKASDTAEILYTTGTTGASKGIEITHGNNIALAENVMYGTEMKPGNRELIPLPVSHSHGLRCCYANLLNGSAVVLTDGVSWAKSVFGLIEEYRVTAMDVSPSAVMVLYQLARKKFAEIAPQIDYIQVGTEALPENVKEILIENFPEARLYNFYGSTESGRTCVLDFNQDRGKAGCIGKPTRNASFIVTDDDRNPIESSKENMGLLATAGAMNMKGYWKQPELTEQIMRDGYIFTNDLGYIDEEGYVYTLGRKDDVINYKGIKIAPEEIEESVRKYPEIVDCACVPKPDKLSGQVPKLFVTVRDGGNFDKKDLFEFLKDHIDGNKMPKEVEVIDEIPRTFNGKIHRMKLMGR